MKEGVYHLLELKALHHPAFALAFSQVSIHPSIHVMLYKILELKILFNPEMCHIMKVKLFANTLIDNECSSGCQFVIGPLMDVLAESSLYHR